MRRNGINFGSEIRVHEGKSLTTFTGISTRPQEKGCSGWIMTRSRKRRRVINSTGARTVRGKRTNSRSSRNQRINISDKTNPNGTSA